MPEDMTLTVDTTNFNRGMAAFVDKLGLEAKVVVKKECGELLKTLVKITPPKNPDKTRESIKQNVFKKISMLDVNTRSGGELSKSEPTVYYAANSRYLFGYAPDRDMRKASAGEIRQLWYRTSVIGRGEHKQPRQIFPMHRKGRQRVALLQNVFTTKAQRNTLIRQIQAHTGRLKAGWMGFNGSTWDFLRPSGGNQPPQWVTRHRNGAQGYYINGLGVKGAPSFTIANTARGVGNPRLQLAGLVRAAMAIRAKAMTTNLALFIRKKKNLSDYARA